MAKRKRDSSRAEPVRETPSTTADESDGTKTIAVADNPFKVKVFPFTESSKQVKAQGSWTGLHVQSAVVPHGPKCTYRVSPAAKWNEMKKYNKFVVSEKPFGIGDYIYIYHGDQLQGTSLDPAVASNWVAQVLEIRALDTSHVYLRVFWMYWPDELPGGRETYHGAYELVASNHMEIMDAMTVTDRADVLLLDEDSPSPAEDLYWRQSLDFNTGKLTKLRRDCYCNAYHNPEKLLIQCAHCSKQLHEECLLRDACNRAWLEQTSRDKSSNASDQLQRELSGTPKAIRSTIPDSQKSNGTNSTLASTQLPPPPPPRAIYSKSNAKKRKSINNSASDPWEDKMKAHLVMKQEDGDETNEATGMAIVCYDPVDEPSQNIEVGLRCLMPTCGGWLYEDPKRKRDYNHGDAKIKRETRYKTTVESDSEDSDTGGAVKQPKLEENGSP